MKIATILVSVFLVTHATSEDELWSEFKKNYSKDYKNLLEEEYRFSIFQSNLHIIEDHNAKYGNDEETYSLTLNQFADLTDEEFKSSFLNSGTPETDYTELSEPPTDVPDEIDWRKEGAVLGIKNQGHIGASIAFSTTGALEGQNAIKHGVKLTLDETQISECCRVGKECENGTIAEVVNYLKNHGICTDDVNPFNCSDSVVGNCPIGKDSCIKVTGFVKVPANEESLKQAVGMIGPIAIALNALDLRFYTGGIFNKKNCEKQLNHAVLVIGYGCLNGLDYWLVKNSWGINWGENGYFRIARNQDQECGISLQSWYPIVA